VSTATIITLQEDQVQFQHKINCR